jgi:hypothetical protein
MSNYLDTDALATAEMLKMFESMELALPATDEAHSIEADISEEVTSELSTSELPVISTTYDDMNAIDGALQPQPPATSHAITEQLNSVVQNAVNALQDWLTIRQASEDKGPQQGLAQLDFLLDTVNQQQQQLADQLAASAALNIPALAAALGTSMPIPQALGWSQEQWREKAEDVSHKTDQIMAMNAKLRKQLEQF